MALFESFDRLNPRSITFGLSTFALAASLSSGCQANTTDVNARAAQTPTPTAAPQTALDRYMSRNEAVYKWENAFPGEFAPGDGDFNLALTSQTWQNTTWKHRMQVFVPSKGKFAHPDAAIVNIAFGSGTLPETLLGRILADTTGAVVVNLFNVPNQPLFERYEDWLMAHTFTQFVKTGDETWPLLFPMAKSATQAMRALDEWSAQTRKQPIKRFVLTGPSKRGWAAYGAAAYLQAAPTSASNGREVVGLVPIVYNNLNIEDVTRHQRAIWEVPSSLARPYQEIRFDDPKWLEAQPRLLEIVDPYAMRERLTMPKFIVAASNDDFFPIESTRFYLNDLPGQTDVFFVPNATHMLFDKVFPIVGSAANWSRRVLDKKPIPSVELDAQPDEAGVTFTLAPQNLEKDARVRLWVASAPTLDFREATWRSVPLVARDGKYSVDVSNARLYEAGKNAKAFAEIELPDTTQAAPGGLRVSSQLWESSR